MREVRIKLVSRDPIVEYNITKPQDSIVLMQEIIGDMASEFFAAVYMNAKNKPLDFIIAGVGGVEKTAIEPSSVVKGALLQNAAKIMLFHNHPSGDLLPSAADLAATQRCMIAAKLYDIPILDHIIVSGKEYYSFAEHGLMELSDHDYLDGLRELKNMTIEEFDEKYAFRISDYYGEVNTL